MSRLIRTLLRSLMPMAVLVLGAVLLMPAPALAAEPTFSITGKGYGHGIGMSQYGARGYARHSWKYDAIIKHYFTGVSVSAASWATDSLNEPTVKVAIQKTNTAATYWTMRANSGQLWIAEGDSQDASLKLTKGVYYTICIPGGSGDTRIVVRHVDSTGKTVVDKTFASTVDSVRAWERDTSQPRYAGKVEISNASGPWAWTGVAYRGSIILSRDTSSVTTLHLYNLLYIEDYLKGVVPREMPASWETEAVKAQAVAARSYAYTSTKVGDFDVWCTTSSQVYNGWGLYSSTYKTIVRHGDTYNSGTAGDYLSDPEVDATKGKMAYWGGNWVRTYFHSTSGGHTENIENVWQFTSMPSSIYGFYKGVVDEYEWDSGAAYTATWGAPIVKTATQLKTALGASAPATIVAVRITARGVSGRAKTVRLYGADGTSKDIRGDDFRSELGLKDTFFEIAGTGTLRIEGVDRYDTAVKVSQQAFSTSTVAIIANGSAYADALGASGLAGAVPGGAPVLLTAKSALTTVTRNELVRLGVTQVYVIGGTEVVSDDVLVALRALPKLATNPTTQVVRLSGANRFETSAAVANKIHALLGTSYSGRVLLVNGNKYADAVAAAGLAYNKKLPVILTESNSVPAASIDAIQSLGATKALVVGGTAVVSDAAITSLGITGQRIAAGTDRYDTAAKLATYVTASEGFTWSRMYLVSGETLVDALAGGPLAGKYGAPMLFMRKTSVPSPTATAVIAHQLTDRYLLGGESAVSASAVQALDALH